MFDYKTEDASTQAAARRLSGVYNRQEPPAIVHTALVLLVCMHRNSKIGDKKKRSILKRTPPFCCAFLCWRRSITKSRPVGVAPLSRGRLGAPPTTHPNRPYRNISSRRLSDWQKA